MSHLVVLMIYGYQRWISPFLPKSCRFYPTCSQYAIEAYQRFGLFKGTWLAVLRLLKCHPFHPGGVDLIPEEKNSSQTIQRK
ncbi:membrane protein insertion efficiency factor YidD [Deltaproteobacteria bacterium TL4]